MNAQLQYIDHNRKMVQLNFVEQIETNEILAEKKLIRCEYCAMQNFCLLANGSRACVKQFEFAEEF